MKKRADGRYLKQVLIGQKENGKPRYKNIYGTSKADVEQRAALFKAEYEKGVAVLDDNLTFDMWADKWLKTYKSNVQYNTYKMYENIIKTHLSPALGSYKIKNIKKHHLQEIINNLIAQDKYSTARQARLTLKQIFDQAVENEYVYKNPASGIALPKQPKTQKRALTQQEVNLFTVADFAPKEKTFVYLILYCGLRRGEALALKTSDIDFENRKISINKSLIFKENDAEIKNMPKSEAGIRVIPVVDDLYDVLYDFANDKSGYIFTMENGKIMSKSSFRKFWNRIMNKVNEAAQKEKTPLSEDITPHMFRHTFATNLYYAGIDIKTAQYLLGHSSIKMTMDIYTHLESEETSKTQDILNQFYKKSSQKSVN
ncbi:MAG: site-specific integrase [Clostridiales bacterium]|nr:site-specific integrase [Clostridiales bacterium]